METVLYADVLFVIDFCMDYLSLYAASRLLARHTGLPRCILAAMLGALYGVLAVVLGLDGIPGAICTAGVSVLMTVIAFGVQGGAVAVFRAAFTVWGCGALLGGVMTAFSGMFGVSVMRGGADLLCTGGVTAFALIRLARRRLCRGTAEILLTYGERRWQGTALVDSGNLLTDPIGGYAVILLGAPHARVLLGAAADTLFRGDFSEIGTGVRAVPVRGVDGTRILYGYLCREVKIARGGQSTVRSAVVCVDHGAPADGYGGCAALLPASLL